MSQLSFSSFDASLLVRDAPGALSAGDCRSDSGSWRARLSTRRCQRGALFTSPELVKDYLRTKLAGFEHEVFAALFLDSQHRLIEYVELFRGTIDSGIGVSARSGEGGTAAQRSGGDLLAQPSERKSRAEPGG